jgi:hypothetical protein
VNIDLPDITIFQDGADKPEALKNFEKITGAAVTYTQADLAQVLQYDLRRCMDSMQLYQSRFIYTEAERGISKIRAIFKVVYEGIDYFFKIQQDSTSHSDLQVFTDSKTGNATTVLSVIVQVNDDNKDHLPRSEEVGLHVNKYFTI